MDHERIRGLNVDVDLLQWPATLVTIAAAWFVAAKGKVQRAIGFWLFLLSNALWIVWAVPAGAKALIVLQVGLAAMNIRGAWKVRREEHSGVSTNSTSPQRDESTADIAGHAQHDGSPVLVEQESSKASGTWWPAEFGYPNSSGAQDGTRYAWFASMSRLAIEANGSMRVYDTLGHDIRGFSQDQATGISLRFSTQLGPVDVDTLPLIHAARMVRHTVPSKPMASDTGDVFATIERLAELRDRGVLSEEEFTAKKAQLLDRL